MDKKLKNIIGHKILRINTLENSITFCFDNGRTISINTEKIEFGEWEMIKAQEIIRAAAIRRNDGVISEGKHHAEIIKKSPVGTCKKGSIQGFVTNLHRFVDRKEAGKIAFEAGQISKDPKGDIILSEEIWFYGDYDYTEEKGYFIKENNNG